MKKTKKPPQVKVAQSLRQAAGLVGLSVETLKEFKNSGCPAFRGSRVYLPELREWMLANRDTIREARKLDTIKAQKEAADLRRAIAQAERIEIQNARSRRLLVLASDYEADIRKIQGMVDAALDALPSRVAPDLAGRNPAEVESILKAEITRMRRGFRA